MGAYWSIEECGWRTADGAPADALATPWSVRGIDAWSPPVPADAAEVLRMRRPVAAVPKQAAPADGELLLPR